MYVGGLDFELLLEEVSQSRPRLIVIDTLQKAASGADQNAASDMAIIHSRFAQLKMAAGGATILVVAHSDKSDSSTRGSSSIEDDSDFILHVRKGTGNAVELEVAKMRDGESPAPSTFYLQQVGNSVVVSPSPDAPAPASDSQARIEVLTALHEIHLVTSFDEAVSFADLKGQVRGLGQREIIGVLISLIAEGLVVRTQIGRKSYRMTPQGRAWIESRDARLFALSKGL